MPLSSHKFEGICVIFDLDGTLVDSEGLCNQAFLDLLPQLSDTVESLIQRYRGKKLTSIAYSGHSRSPAPVGRDQRFRFDLITQSADHEHRKLRSAGFGHSSRTMGSDLVKMTGRVSPTAIHE